MASNQQPYGYGPPPPPPSQSVAPQNTYSPYNPQLGYNQPPSTPQSNGRGRGGRGRGGNFTNGGRGDFHSPSPFNPQVGGYSTPGGYGAPPAVNGGYGPQTPAYGNQPTASPYPSAPPPPQWQNEQQHHQQQQPQTAPPPLPLSAQNYHPNYAPQVYQSQPTVYGQNPQPQQPPLHQQQPQYQNSPQPPSSFAQNAHSSQPPIPGGPPPQQWGGPSHHPQNPQFNSGRGGRGRGGGHQGHRSFDAPLMGPPIRMGFDNDHMSQASNSYPPFTTPQHGSPPVNISSPSPMYQNNQNGYRSQDYSQRGGGGHRGGHRAPLDPNPFYGNNNRGGRGGFSNQRGNFSNRGNRGDMQSNGFKPRYNRDFKSYTDNRNYSTSEAASDLPSKPGLTSTGMNSDGKKKQKKKKRKTNTLGLTPGNGEDSATEDDENEENRLGPLVIGTSAVPHNLTEWIAERKRKWPTAAIREAKAAELAKRREQAREQSLRDKAKAQKDREERAAIEAKLAQVTGRDPKKSKKHDGESKLERQQRKAEKLRKQLEKAEKKVQHAQHAIQAGSKRKREIGDEGDGSIKQEDQSGDQVKAGDDDSVSDSSSSSSDSDSDDDSEPEAQSSRKSFNNDQNWYKPHPLLHTKPCKYFSSGGTCGKMNKCRFIHDQAARDASLKERARDGVRVSLAELLLQNEQDKENLTVLKAIQYVAENGLLDEPQQSNPTATGQTTNQNVGTSGVTENQIKPETPSDNDDSGADNFHEAMTDVVST